MTTMISDGNIITYQAVLPPLQQQCITSLAMTRKIGIMGINDSHKKLYIKKCILMPSESIGDDSINRDILSLKSISNITF